MLPEDSQHERNEPSPADRATHRPAARPGEARPAGDVTGHREEVAGRGPGGTAGGPPANDAHDRDNSAIPVDPTAQGGEGEHSNTPSPKTTTGGEDWLSVNFYVTFPKFDELCKLLDRAQAAAVNLSGTSHSQETPVYSDEITLENIRFIVSPRGARLGGGPKALGMRYRLLSEHGLTVLIANMPEARKTTPNVNITATSLSLMKMDCLTVWRHMNEYINALGGRLVKSTISRVDACVDLSNIPVSKFSTPFSKDWMTSRARQKDFYETKFSMSSHRYGRKSTGFAIGKTPLRLRVYDKLLEVKKDPEKLAIMIARRWGTLPEQATRIEFQISREHLKKLGVNTVPDWFIKRAAILDKLTLEWFRLTIGPVDRNHAKRTPTLPIWEEARQAFFEWCDGDRDLPLVPLPKLHVDMSKQVKQMVGMFTGICARVGKDIYDNEKYYREFMFAIRDVVGNRDMQEEVRRKALELGNPLPKPDPMEK